MNKRELFQRQLDGFVRVCGWLFLSLVALGIFASLFAQNLPEPQLNLPASEAKKWNWEKTAGIGLIVIASVADGMVEGYEFDGRTSFERKFGASPTKFWGSRSWENAYIDRDVSKGFKPGFTKWFGSVDFYHVADDVRHIGYIGGGVLLGIGIKKSKGGWKRAAIELGSTVIISSLSKRAGMAWIRN